MSVFFNKIRGWFDAAALSSEFTIVSARGVKFRIEDINAIDIRAKASGNATT